MEETAVLSDLQACLGKDNAGQQKEGSVGIFLRGPPATSSISNKEPGSTSPHWFSPYLVFWPCARASLALIRPSASGGWRLCARFLEK